MPHHVEQLGDTGRIATFGTINGLLRQPVTQHIFGIGRMHDAAAFVFGLPGLQHTVRMTLQPFLQRRQYLHTCLG
ncbi:hypothetical protein D3C81_1773310 [compost metagenome]